MREWWSQVGNRAVEGGWVESDDDEMVRGCEQVSRWTIGSSVRAETANQINKSNPIKTQSRVELESLKPRSID